MMDAVLYACVAIVALAVGRLWLNWLRQRHNRRDRAELLSELRKARHV